MLSGGWSKTTSVRGPRTTTRRRSSTDTLRLGRVQQPDGRLERDPGAATPATLDEHPRGREGGEQPRNRVGDRRTAEARRVVPGRPAAAALGGHPVAGTVVVLERAQRHDRQRRRQRPQRGVVEAGVREDAARLALHEQVGRPEQAGELGAAFGAVEVKRSPLLATSEVVAKWEGIGPARVL